jgi:hypothetical protein
MVQSDLARRVGERSGIPLPVRDVSVAVLVPAGQDAVGASAVGCARQRCWSVWLSSG